MNCQTCREHMIELADARLDAETAAAVRGHIDACEACRARIRDVQPHARGARRHPRPPPTHRLRAQVMGPIEAEKLTLEEPGRMGVVHPLGRGPTRRRRLRGSSYVLQAPGVCTLVALGFILGERTATQRQIADLRARVDTVGQLVEQSVLQKRTTGDRLETVLTAAPPASPTSGSSTGSSTRWRSTRA